MNPLEQNKEPEKVVMEEATTQETSPIIEETTELIISENDVPVAEITENETESPKIEEDEPTALEESDIKEESNAVEEVEPKENSEPVISDKTDYLLLDREQLIDALKNLMGDGKDIDKIKDEVELIKQTFYKKQKAHVEELKKKFAEDGGEEQDFKLEKDELEDEFKTCLNTYRDKKAEYAAVKEKEKEDNLLQKQHILEQMKVLTETTDDVSSHINEFKELQAKWKLVGMVPATMSTELWKNYNLLQEKFWDLVKINNELRDYAFRKNLEAKTQLCETAERLTEEKDVVMAARQLQKLHEEWREIGPVAREVREEIWNRFKEATNTINKKHQSFFEELRQGEEENLTKKVEVCEKIENFDYSELKTYNAWEKATQTIIGFQEEWRAIGFAPRKANQKIFERYRKSCDDFFAAKANFYKEAKAEMAANLEKKKELCEQAEAMKDNTDWRETTDKFVKLQKQWKEIGPVSKKHSDEVWKRFISACDYFFEQKNKNVSDLKAEETDNLAKKQALINQIEGLLPSENQQETYAALKQLMEEWRGIGHVPYKEKDKIYKAYKAAIDKQFDSLNIDVQNRRLDSFRSNLEDMTLKGDQKLYREREKLMRVFENMKNEIATYENNIGFFSSSSKKADSLLKEMERKIEGLKEECKLIEQKITLIEDKLSSN